MKQQGQYMKWEMARPRKISWHEMWRMDGQKISFLLRSVYDVLPTRANLTMWKLIEDPRCAASQRIWNIFVVLQNNSKGWRYNALRHDQVLQEIASVLDTQRGRRLR